MIIRCSCRSSFRLLLHFHAQNSRHISRPPRSIRGKKRGKPLIYIAPYVLGASRSSRSDSTRLRPASSCFRDSSGLCSVWSVCALSFGKACAAVPACAVVAGVQCGGPWRAAVAGLGAYLARRGCLRGRWRAFGGGRCNTLPALHCAPLRPFYGLVAGSCLAVCLCSLPPLLAAWLVLAWLSGCAWFLPPLRCGPLQPPPLRLLVLHFSRARLARPCGRRGVALVQSQIFKELRRRCWRCRLWWLWRVSNPRRLAAVSR